MKKVELVDIFDSLGIPCDEGAQKMETAGSYPRIVYFDYIWDDILASNSNYETKETYQISFFSKEPRHSALLELRKKLRDRGIFTTFYNEYVQKDKVFHTYCSAEICNDE